MVLILPSSRFYFCAVLLLFECPQDHLVLICTYFQQAKEREIEENIKYFKDIFEKNNAELLELTEEKHKETEGRGEELIRELDEEIKELKRRQTELEQLSNPMDFTQVSLSH